MRPIIGITMGDPVGIGPEVILKALSKKELYEICRPLVFGDVRVMTRTNEWLKTGLGIRRLERPESGLYEPGTVDIVGLSDLGTSEVKYGHPTQATSRAMVRYIIEAVDWAMESRIDGLATCPINKMAMHSAGFDYEGHTELLAQRTNTSDYVMMLAGRKLRVALVTIHLPLSRVSRKLTIRAVLKTIRITEEALRNSFGIHRPRLAVAALNPHAGERGLFGDEEIRIISPAIRRAAAAGIDVSGTRHTVLLGLTGQVGRNRGHVSRSGSYSLQDGSFFRWCEHHARPSVDHGTAYDIAGTGKADPHSLMAAIRMAAHQAITRIKSRG